MLSKLLEHKEKPDKDIRQSISLLLPHYYTEGRKDHATHVTKIALKLFNALRAIDKVNYGQTELNILYVAASLHDIGYASQLQDTAHELFSRVYIHREQLNIQGLSTKELNMAALIAYYHRNESPSEKSIVFKNLNLEHQHVVRVLSAILKLADVLDKDNKQHIKGITLIPTIDGLTLILGVKKKKKYDAHWSPFQNMKRFHQRLNAKTEDWQHMFGTLRIEYTLVD